MKLFLTVLGGIMFSISLWFLLLGAIAQCFVLTMEFFPEYRNPIHIGDTEQVVYQKLGLPETVLFAESRESSESGNDWLLASRSLIYPDLEPGLTVDIDPTTRVTNVHLGSSFIRTGVINPIEVTNLVFMLGLALFLFFRMADVENKVLLKPLVYSILSAVLANTFFLLTFQTTLGIGTKVAILFGVAAPLVYCWGLYQGFKQFLREFGRTSHKV
jgi:hypothetical protein